MLRAGQFLQNRYEILELIGSGGMSDVYKAKCHKLDRLVAIKVLKEELSSDDSFVAKFKMEAQAAAGLSHPNIVSVYDVVDEGQLHYIVMELIEGITLKTYIARKGKLDVKEAVGIAIQVAQGIAAAHEQNIIHRDIKPQNMIISRDGKVKVADFGIARVVTAQTQGSAAVGSVHYISPEQARGGYSDARSDIYSLGITMYEMVTGRLPFEGDNTVSVALAHVEEPITRPSIYEPDIPVSLENIILKCTEKKPERRYSSVTEVIADLRRVLLHPDENFVTMAPEIDYSADTRQISEDELKVINLSHKSYQPMQQDLEPDYMEEPEYTREPERPSNVSRRIERILTSAGVLVAVIIVAVLIVLFSRIGGLFRSGSGLNIGLGDTQSSIQMETVSDESKPQLADTEVLAPDAKNLPVDMAEAKLKESTLVMRVVRYEESDTVENNYVISQSPEEGTVVEKYSTVDVVVSTGNGMIDLQALALTSMDKAAAAAVLAQNGLKSEFFDEYNDTVAQDKIVRYEPAQVREGETVTLYVSLGPAPVMRTVPDLYNITEEEARQRLIDAKLNPGEVTRSFDAVIPQGYVISQNIAANESVEEGSRISFVVSDGPEPPPQRHIAAISETYDLQGAFGPGMEGTTLKLEVRLRQDAEDGSQYRTLMEATEVTTGSLLPIEFPEIEAIIPGAEYGEVEVVNAESGQVLASYPVQFFVTE